MRTGRRGVLPEVGTYEHAKVELGMRLPLIDLSLDALHDLTLYRLLGYRIERMFG